MKKIEPSRFNKVKAAQQAVEAALEHAQAVTEEQYEVGSMVIWARGKSVQHGTIERVGYFQHPRFFVRNVETEKAYWIAFYDIECAYAILEERARDKFLGAA